MFKACKCGDPKHSYYHLGCLRRKAKSEVLQIDGPNARIFQWKSFACSKCKQAFPAQVKIGNRAFDVISWKRPPRPCMVLEKITKKEVGKVNISELAILHFKTKSECLIGQGPQADLRLQDNTASVVHSSVKFQKNRFFLFDNGKTRFGTLVGLRKAFPLVTNGVGFQVGNTVFYLFIENIKIVYRLKERKFQRFEPVSNNTFSWVIKNLKTRMKSIAVNDGTQTF